MSTETQPKAKTDLGEVLVAEGGSSPSTSGGTTPSTTSPPVVGGRAGVKQAITAGNLKDKVKEPTFLGEVKEWLKTADSADPEQKAELVALLKAVDDPPFKQQVFEKLFKTKVKSSTTKYEPIMFKGQPKKDRNGKPMLRDTFVDNVPVDARALDSITDIMSQFPSKHIPPNWIVASHNRDKGTTGSYNEQTNQAELTFSLLDVEGGYTQEYTNCAPGDVLEHVKAFDFLIRHEVGHAASATVPMKTLTGSPAGGAWIDHGSLDAALTAMGSVYDGFVTAVQRTGAPAAAAIRKAVIAGADSMWDPESIAEELKIPGDRVPADHDLLKVLNQAQSFVCGTSPVDAGGRMFIVGGPDRHWFSFARSSWAKRLSYYQFATPEEWFAEFYAAANNAEKSVRDGAKTQFGDAWRWLDTNGCIVVGK